MFGGHQGLGKLQSLLPRGLNDFDGSPPRRGYPPTPSNSNSSAGRAILSPQIARNLSCSLLSEVLPASGGTGSRLVSLAPSQGTFVRRLTSLCWFFAAFGCWGAAAT